MDQPQMVEILRDYSETLEREIVQLENQIRPLVEKLTRLREKKRAAEELTASDEGKVLESESRPVKMGIPAQVRLRAASTRPYTPTRFYWVPILESLVELGGDAVADDVVEKVDHKMAGVLTPQDYDLLPSGISIRWRNRVQWQRKNMVDQGLLRSDSPRGVWQITPEGRKWLELNSAEWRELHARRGQVAM